MKGEGIVLYVRNFGESNAIVTLLCRDWGILYATLYGGPRSRLRGKLSQWNSGVASLYCSHTGDMEKRVKVTDFAVENFHLSFRECIYKDFAASIAAELSIATKCAGNPIETYTLVKAFLDGLEVTDEGDAQKASLVRFLWRYLAVLGVQCNASACAICGGSTKAGAIYNTIQDGFVCLKCAREEGNESEARRGMHIEGEALSYLISVTNDKPSISRAMHIGKSALSSLKALTFMLVQNAVGHPLRSIKSGVGIL